MVTTSYSVPDIFTASLHVIKRNGQAVSFEANKIFDAISKAILAVEGDAASGSLRIQQIAHTITDDLLQRFHRQFPQGGKIFIEDIQDQVELGLMRLGHQKVAHAYVLYREEHAKQRRQEKLVADDASGIITLDPHGKDTFFSYAELSRRIHSACTGFDSVVPESIIEQCKHSLYQGMQLEDIDTALLMTVRPMVEQEPNYAFVCAQLLLKKLQRQVSHFLELSVEDKNFYINAFEKTIAQGIRLKLLDERLARFDLPVLAKTIKPERDRQFNYLGLQTLFDRYFLQHKEKRIEMPQIFFMRVAMGLSLLEDNPTERAIEFYHLISSFDYMCSTPTLFNSGTLRPQLSSCYLTTVDDDLAAIYQSIADNAQLSKWAGGLGNDWTRVRGLGARIEGTKGKSQGVIPFLKVVNDTAVAVNQGGKRKGAVCAYLESWHIDIEDFLELRKNTGDERRRTHDMNSASWIPDLFMKRVITDQEWTLFSPHDVSDLHDIYGKAFEERYLAYEEKIQTGEIKLFKKIPAKQLWQKMLSMLYETGHPWITFKDPCNIRSPQQHCGVVHSSNLCTEITLNTNENEIAVCNLGSVNLARHIKNGQIDQEHLQKTISTAIRLLDNVIDLNFYPVEKAKTSNLKHRPIGLGLMGFQDVLYQLRMPYASVDAVQFADHSMELISFYAIEASINLAKERGHYPSFKNSLWDKGQLPIDSLKTLQKERGEDFCSFDFISQLNWESIRQQLKQFGIRNSNIMAIAPTATISNIVGVSQSIEPTYQNLYVKSNLSGEFMVINQALVNELKALGLWDQVMINDLKYFDGSVQPIERIPEYIKAVYATAFEMDSRWLVEAASRRQKWLDQAQSLNLYLAEPSGKTLDNLYKMAWSRGLKTTYYLRSLGATKVEKVTVAEKDKTKTQISDEAPKVCSILEPECEACQ
ncbi:ribonucleoside-diphosphate reductase subunit alpha [Aliikangiella sp. G2MR2-5]|uniref:ribonucleoside-diphosphate reductase subunit alpha n=1 Tax=Aliikangiella sp. G2MR2-5 TaxID=2788943 RepID=UPI0018A92C0C|nr:ribonucleoside-diphosphate reductase subunit alpha [Aliikangiella sp. G2MR2-5]